MQCTTLVQCILLCSTRRIRRGHVLKLGHGEKNMLEAVRRSNRVEPRNKPDAIATDEEQDTFFLLLEKFDRPRFQLDTAPTQPKLGHTHAGSRGTGKNPSPSDTLKGWKNPTKIYPSSVGETHYSSRPVWCKANAVGRWPFPPTEVW